MKHLLFALTIFLAAGCSVLQSSNYDPHEYSGFIKIMTQAEKVHEACGTANHQQLLIAGISVETTAHSLENYTTYRPNNESTVEIVKIIRKTATEFVDRYKTSSPSKIYCENKTQNVIDQSKIGAESVQKKVRR
jgi:hypothetical protein